MMRQTALIVSVSVSVSVGVGVAHAGGPSRPNPISARGVGMGGAFTALADDVTALHFNPAALAFVVPQATVGGELIIAPRRYTPLLSDGSHGPPQAATPRVPLPVLGVVGRFSSEGIPSAFTFGVGVWNTFGGQLEYEPTGMSALDATQDAVIEIVPGFSYKFDDRLAVGAALRVGIGLFAVSATQRPLDSDASAQGIGLSYTGGVLVTPHPALRIGLTWRGPLTVRTSGTSTVVFPDPRGADQIDVEHTQRWPQQLSLGVGVRALSWLRIAAQLDWTDWSRVDAIGVEFPDEQSLSQRTPVDWNDNLAVRLGLEGQVHRRLTLRLGAYYDTSAVPDRTIERQFGDKPKIGLAAGTGLQLSRRWRVDAAVDVVIPSTRTVGDNRMTVGTWTSRANVAPGDYWGALYSFGLAVSRAL